MTRKCIEKEGIIRQLCLGAPWQLSVENKQHYFSQFTEVFLENQRRSILQAMQISIKCPCINMNTIHMYLIHVLFNKFESNAKIIMMLTKLYDDFIIYVQQ